MLSDFTNFCITLYLLPNCILLPFWDACCFTLVIIPMVLLYAHSPFPNFSPFVHLSHFCLYLHVLVVVIQEVGQYCAADEHLLSMCVSQRSLFIQFAATVAWSAKLKKKKRNPTCSSSPPATACCLFPLFSPSLDYPVSSWPCVNRWRKSLTAAVPA